MMSWRWQVFELLSKISLVLQEKDVLSETKVFKTKRGKFKEYHLLTGLV